MKILINLHTGECGSIFNGNLFNTTLPEIYTNHTTKKKIEKELVSNKDKQRLKLYELVSIEIKSKYWFYDNELNIFKKKSMYETSP